MCAYNLDYGSIIVLIQYLSTKITLTIEDTKDGQAKITDDRLPHSGELKDSVVSAVVLADVMLEHMAELSEVDESNGCLIHF